MSMEKAGKFIKNVGSMLKSVGTTPENSPSFKIPESIPKIGGEELKLTRRQALFGIAGTVGVVAAASGYTAGVVKEAVKSAIYSPENLYRSLKSIYFIEEKTEGGRTVYDLQLVSISKKSIQELISDLDGYVEKKYQENIKTAFLGESLDSKKSVLDSSQEVSDYLKNNVVLIPLDERKNIFLKVRKMQENILD